MSSRAQVAGEILIRVHRFERGRRSTIAVLADQSVDSRVFAKYSYARREDDQLRIVRQRHACTVDRLVAQPGTVKFMRIKINDSLPNVRLEGLEVHFQAERGGIVKTFSIVADEESAHCQLVVRGASDNCEYVDNGKISQETIGRVIENVAHRILRATHDALHPINCAQVMAAVYALAASGAHQNVLVVIRHADNFVRYDLADRENEIETAVRNETIYLRWPRVVQLAFGLLVDELGRDLAESLDVGSPVVGAEERLRHGAKHSRDLLGLHSSMGAQSRQYCLHPVAIILPRVARQIAGAGMYAALIGWHNEHAISLPQFGKILRKQLLQLRKQIAFDSARVAVEASTVNSPFFSPGASKYKTSKASK